MSHIDERALIADVQQRLTTAFPQCSPIDVRVVVTEAYAGFAACRVRDFVPLLVERHATRELAALSAASYS